MKLAFTLFEYFPYGGMQRDMLAIARAAAQRGHQVTIFTREWHGERPAGLEIRVFETGGASNHVRGARFASQVLPHLSGFDRVVGFSKMPGLDWYYAADGCLAARYRGLYRLMPRYRSRLAMERAVFGGEQKCRILSISPPQRTLYQRCYGTSDDRFVALPPGIRRDRCQPQDLPARRAALRADLRLEDDAPMLLFVGSGFRTKGLDRAIRMLARLPSSTRLYVVGDDQAGPYRRLARRQGVADRVHFMGASDDVPRWLWAADLLVHPAYAENTGTVLLEAAVAGLPVLTTSVCGYAPYIGTAKLGEVLDDSPASEDLAAAAARLLAQPREQWRARGRCFAAQADIYDLIGHAVTAIETETGPGKPTPAPSTMENRGSC